MNPKDFRKLSASVKVLTLHQHQVLMDRLQPDAQGEVDCVKAVPVNAVQYPHKPN